MDSLFCKGCTLLKLTGCNPVMMKEKKLFLITFSLAFLVFVLDRKGGLVGVKGQIEKMANPARAVIYSWVKQPGEFLQGLRVKEERVEKVKEVERELEACHYEFQALKKENEDFRRLLQAPLPKSWAFLPAKVLGKKRHLIIDKGKTDGVKEGMTVVFENYLVGRIVKTSALSSLVLLAFDVESKISVRTENGVRGLLEGRFGTKIFLTRVLQKDILALGELVVTSGEEGYLPDLLIGKIKSKEEESHRPFQEAEVEPILEYEKLENVFIVKE